MTSASGEMSENLAWVRERIAVAASRAGRRAEDITLVAISKTHSANKIQALYEAGARHFGENRVQERELKLAPLRGLDAIWHMVGHVQKNKAARAARLFDSIDSVDSAALAERLERARTEFREEGTEGTEATEKRGKGTESLPFAAGKTRLLIEVKLDPEPAKSGVDGHALPRVVEAITPFANLELRGLMGVPPYFDDPEEARPYFRRLRELRDAIHSRTGAERLTVLSMGMSHDFEIAIEEGATEIRVGTALFGDREKA